MAVDDPHNLSEQLRSQKQMLDELRNEDSRLLWDFAAAASKELADSTVIQYLSKLRLISETADEPLIELTPRKLDNVLDSLEDERAWDSNGTRRNYEKALRTLSRELRDAEPEEFGRDYTNLLPSRGAIRMTKKEEKKITPDDILSREDIETLIQECCRTTRDRALVAMLADTGMRIAALLSLRVGDVEFREQNGGGFFQPNTEASGLKGDDAKKPLTWSAAHVETYLGNEHPRPDTEKAPLFHKTDGWTNEDDDGSMSPASVRQRLKRLVRGADVSLNEENVHPHVFRHTAVSIWARQGFTDREIKHRAGWSRDSDMLDRYEHIKEEELNKQVLKRHGIKIDDDNISEPELDQCPRCNAPLHGEENYCPRCSAHLDSPDKTVEEVLADNVIDSKISPDPEWVDQYGWQDAVDRLVRRDVTKKEMRELVAASPDRVLEQNLTGWHKNRLRERYKIEI